MTVHPAGSRLPWPLGLTLACASCNGSSSTEAVSSASPTALGSSVTLTNLGLPVKEMFRGPEHFIVTVPESGHGEQDLNGDGDAADEVLFLVDSRSQRITRTGLASRPLFTWYAPAPQFGPDFVALPVGEEQQGQRDLNGDGDVEDIVLHVLDLSTLDIEVLEYGLDPYGLADVAAHEDSLSFLVSERAQGEVDVNGDGDLLDSSLHIWDARTSFVERVAVSVIGDLALSGDSLAFHRREDAVTGDLNGDGDTMDAVFHMLDVRTRTISNTELASGYVVVPVAGAWLAVAWDGNQSPTYASVDVATGEVTHFDVRPGSYALPFGDLVALDVPEWTVDLNGDGDAWDRIAYALDPRTGAEFSSGLAAENLVVLDGWIGFLVDERDQGDTDLNGDGQLGARVPHVFDPATGATVNLGGDAFDLRPAGRYLYFMRDEAVAGLDWNEDGDTDDYVPFWWDSQTFVTHHSKRSSWSALDLRYGTLLTGVPESGESEDLNGDGDLDDVVTFAIDLATGAMANTGKVTGPGHLLSARTALLRISEFVHTEDLNGDGDFQDEVLFHAELFR